MPPLWGRNLGGKAGKRRGEKGTQLVSGVSNSEMSHVPLSAAGTKAGVTHIHGKPAQEEQTPPQGKQAGVVGP
jgi:hypothetical protein